MYCNGNCNRLCPNLIISDNISVETIDTTPTLVIDIPEGSYGDGEIYGIVTAQTIPAEATVTAPVAISIGGDTTTVYPLVCSRTGLQATACQVNTRTRIRTIVRTSATSGSFIALNGLGNCFVNRLASLPAPATTTQVATPTANKLAVKTTKKTEVTSNG